MDSPELAAVVSYWSRILRCPWRANGNAFYTRALKFLKLGHEPNLERGAKRRFLKWMDEGFEWSEKHQHIILTTDTPFPTQINLPRISRTFIVVSGKKEAAEIVEAAYKVNQVGMSGGERLFDTLRSQYLNLTRSDVYATLKRFKSRLLGRAPEANPTIRPRIMERVFQECQIDIIDFGGSSKKAPVSGKALPSDLTRANSGYRYILTGSCSFSKFMFCCEPLKTKSTAVYAAVLTEIFCLLGPPETLLADREFDCAEIHLMCLRLSIEPRFTKSYDKARTGSIERLNSSVRTALQNYMSQNNTDVWFRHTQELMLSYNRKKHSATKMAPFEVMFRRHSASTIDQQVHMNTEDNAARMVRAYQRKYGESAVEVYDIGDSVLVATRTEHEIKKMSQISITTMRKKNKLTAWSKKPFRITDKRMALDDELDLAPKKLSKAQQLAQMVPVNKTTKGHGSREWWATASKAERKVALGYRYLLTNGKWYSPLNLLYIDPDVKYIPIEGKTAAWDKLKGSEKAGQENEMGDADIAAANIEEENVAVASKILAAMQKQAPGLELASVKPPTRSTTKKVAGKKALPILDTVIPNFPGRLVRHPTEPKASLAGLVLRAVVTSRTKKGRYRVQISGSVPEKGGFRDHTDLELMDKRGLTAALVKKLQGYSEGKAASY